MSVNEIQALAQKFADAFDRRDIKTVLDMLSDEFLCQGLNFIDAHGGFLLSISLDPRSDRV